MHLLLRVGIFSNSFRDFGSIPPFSFHFTICICGCNIRFTTVTSINVCVVQQITWKWWTPLALYAFIVFFCKIDYPQLIALSADTWSDMNEKHREVIIAGTWQQPLLFRFHLIFHHNSPRFLTYNTHNVVYGQRSPHREKWSIAGPRGPANSSHSEVRLFSEFLSNFS